MPTRFLSDEEIAKLKCTEIEILDELDRVCRKNNLEYFMVGGTLLGSVRHKGFIPWDDDIDVVMFRSDLDKLEKLYCNGEFGGNYFLQTENTDKKYPLMTAKLRKNNTVFLEDCMDDNIASHSGIFVDIFPIDDISDLDNPTVRKNAGKISFLTTIICESCGYRYGVSTKVKLLAKVASMIGIGRLKKLRNKLMTNENQQGFDKCTIYASNYGYIKQCRKRDVYSPHCDLEFEGKKYMAPCKYEDFLIQLFGANYMELPPIEKRITRHPIKKIDFGE